MDADSERLILDIVGRASELPIAERHDFVRRECAAHPRLNNPEAIEYGIDLVDEKTGGRFANPVTGLRSDLQVGDLLGGRYRIVAVVGSGAQGKVYEAVDDRVGKRLAIKQMLGRDGLSRRLFEREARVLGQLRNSAPDRVAAALPNVTDFFTDADGLYIAMDFVSGETLTELLQRRGGPLPVDLVLAWGDRLLGILEFLHGHKPDPIIHRDIKPQNLKLTPDGNLVLLDFGLTKGAIAELSRLGRGSTVAAHGTLQYAPIEQIEDGRADERSDIYSLGATLYQLLTATRFPNAIERLKAYRRGADPLRPANEIHVEVPNSVASALERAMQIDAEDRFQSAAEMRGALTGGFSTGPGTEPVSNVRFSAEEETRVRTPVPAGTNLIPREPVVVVVELARDERPLTSAAAPTVRSHVALALFIVPLYVLANAAELVGVIALVTISLGIAAGNGSGLNGLGVLGALITVPSLLGSTFVAVRERSRRWVSREGFRTLPWIVSQVAGGFIGALVGVIVMSVLFPRSRADVGDPIVTSSILFGVSAAFLAEWQQERVLPPLRAALRWMQDNPDWGDYIRMKLSSSPRAETARPERGSISLDPKAMTAFAANNAASTPAVGATPFPLRSETPAPSGAHERATPAVAPPTRKPRTLLRDFGLGMLLSTGGCVLLVVLGVASVLAGYLVGLAPPAYWDLSSGPPSSEPETITPRSMNSNALPEQTLASPMNTNGSAPGNTNSMRSGNTNSGAALAPVDQPVFLPPPPVLTEADWRKSYQYADRWLGTYRFEEVGPRNSGYVWEYEVRVYRNEDGVVIADFDVDGRQTLIRARCDVLVCDEGATLILIYRRVYDDAEVPLFDRDGYLLALQRKEYRLWTHWYALEPGLDDTPNPCNCFEGAKK